MNLIHSTRLVFGIAFITSITMSIGCHSLNKGRKVDLGEIYDELAQLPDYERNPVVVVPGIIGSKLVDSETGEIVWGEMGAGAVTPRRTRSLTELALPMQQGVPLHQLHDNVVAVSYTHLTLPTICSV